MLHLKFNTKKMNSIQIKTYIIEKLEKYAKSIKILKTPFKKTSQIDFEVGSEWKKKLPCIEYRF
jgi:hypothetical protein